MMAQRDPVAEPWALKSRLDCCQLPHQLSGPACVCVDFGAVLRPQSDWEARPFVSAATARR